MQQLWYVVAAVISKDFDFLYDRGKKEALIKIIESAIKVAITYVFIKTTHQKVEL